MRPRLTLLLFYCLVHFASSATPFSNFIIKHLESEQLPQSTVSQMLQDRNGYWWIITNGGISRYDGATVKTFTHENLDKLNTQIVAICKNKSGDIIAFDELANAYTATPNGLKLSVVENGYTWRPSLNGYLAVVSSKIISLPNAIITNMVIEGKGIYISASSKTTGVFYKKDMQKTYRVPASLQHLYDYSEGLAFFELNKRLFEIKNGYKLVIYDSNTVVSVSSFTGDILTNPLYKQPINSIYTKIVYADHKPYLVMGQSIYSLSAQQDKIDTKILISNIPADVRPLSLAIDSLDNTIAIGTISSGIYFLQKQIFRVKLASSKSYLDNVFYGVVPMKNDWYYSSKGFTFKLSEPSEISLVQNTSSYKGIFSYNGFTYISFEGKLMKFDNDRNKPELITICPTNGVMVQMDTAQNGRLWLCTKDDIGYMEGDSIIWKTNHLLPSANNSYIECFKFINKNEILIGTGGGLYKYDLADKKVSLIPQLGKAKVRNIVEDENGCYWLCTYGQGLYYYSSGKYYQYKNIGLATPHTVLKDKLNNLWASSNNGLYKINRQALLEHLLNQKPTPVFYRYSKENGFLTNEFNGGCHPCGYQVSDSLFVLPSMDGLVYFNPLETTEPYRQFPIVLDDAEINSIPQPFLPNTTLPFGFQNAQLTLSSPYYGNNTSLNMEYMIEGYDKSWQAVTSDHRIQLKGLPNGDYKLVVRKQVDDRAKPYITTSLPFSVATPFWKTIWFYAILAAVFILLVYAAFKISIKNIMNRKKELRKEVARRTNELELSLEQLSLSNEKLMDTTIFREQIVSFVLHDIRTPLKYISRISQSLYKNHKQMDEKQLHEQIGELHESTIQFTSFSEGFLQWINTHSNKFHLNKKEFNLQESTQNIFNIFNEIAKEKNILLINKLPSDFKVFTDETILGIIVRNIVDNAIKYTASGSIMVSVSTAQNTVITISDTGSGMTEQELAKLKKNLCDRGKSTSGGLGMLIVNDMLQLLNGNMDIESRLGVGTSIKITLDTK